MVLSLDRRGSIGQREAVARLELSIIPELALRRCAFGEVCGCRRRRKWYNLHRGNRFGPQWLEAMARNEREAALMGE